MFLSPHGFPSFPEDPPFFRCALLAFQTNSCISPLLLWPHGRLSCGTLGPEQLQASATQTGCHLHGWSPGPQRLGPRSDRHRLARPAQGNVSVVGLSAQGRPPRCRRNPCTRWPSSWPPWWAGNGTALAQLSESSGLSLCHWLGPSGNRNLG